jgi:nucleotide-binding universal stress UspA family protein
MLKALVPVDGSANSLGAVRHVIKLVKDREPLEIHLLNVQPPMHHDVTMFVSGDAVKEFHLEEGTKALAHARRLLDDAGVLYTQHVVVAHTAEAIVAWASRMHCDKVVMGTRGLGTMTQLFLGSVTHKVIHLMHPGIPVTLVKQGYANLAADEADR